METSRKRKSWHPSLCFSHNKQITQTNAFHRQTSARWRRNELNMIKPINTNNAPAAIGPYSQAIIANGCIFCSGQLGLDPQTGNLVEGIENQTHQVIKNIESVLIEAGSDLKNIVKTTILLKNIADFPKVNEIYG